MRTSISALAFYILFVFAAISVSLSDEHGIIESEKNPGMSCIWSVDSLELGRITMALSQNVSELYGRAKYEPGSGPAWNAPVIGSIEGDKVDLTMIYLHRSFPVSSRLTGIYNSSNGSINGEFLQVSEGKLINKGRFWAVCINPDISSFTPAAIRNEADTGRDETDTGRDLAKAATDDIENPKEVESLSVPTAANQTVEKTALTESKYYDVHQDAESFMTGICGSGLA